MKYNLFFFLNKAPPITTRFSSLQVLLYSILFLAGHTKRILEFGTGGSGYLSVMDPPQNETVEVGPGDLKMSFSLSSGQLKRIFNNRTGVSFVPI